MDQYVLLESTHLRQIVAEVLTDAFVYVSTSSLSQRHHSLALLDGNGPNGMELHETCQSLRHRSLELHQHICHLGHHVGYLKFTDCRSNRSRRVERS